MELKIDIQDILAEVQRLDERLYALAIERCKNRALEQMLMERGTLDTVEENAS